MKSFVLFKSTVHDSRGRSIVLDGGEQPGFFSCVVQADFVNPGGDEGCKVKDVLLDSNMGSLQVDCVEIAEYDVVCEGLSMSVLWIQRDKCRSRGKESKSREIRERRERERERGNDYHVACNAHCFLRYLFGC